MFRCQTRSLHHPQAVYTIETLGECLCAVNCDRKFVDPPLVNGSKHLPGLPSPLRQYQPKSTSSAVSVPTSYGIPPPSALPSFTLPPTPPITTSLLPTLSLERRVCCLCAGLIYPPLPPRAQTNGEVSDFDSGCCAVLPRRLNISSAWPISKNILPNTYSTIFASPGAPDGALTSTAGAMLRAGKGAKAGELKGRDAKATVEKEIPRARSLNLHHQMQEHTWRPSFEGSEQDIDVACSPWRSVSGFPKPSKTPTSLNPSTALDDGYKLTNFLSLRRFFDKMLDFAHHCERERLHASPYRRQKQQPRRPRARDTLQDSTLTSPAGAPAIALGACYILPYLDSSYLNGAAINTPPSTPPIASYMPTFVSSSSSRNGWSSRQQLYPLTLSPTHPTEADASPVRNQPTLTQLDIGVRLTNVEKSGILKSSTIGPDIQPRLLDDRSCRRCCLLLWWRKWSLSKSSTSTNDVHSTPPRLLPAPPPKKEKEKFVKDVARLLRLPANAKAGLSSLSSSSMDAGPSSSTSHSPSVAITSFVSNENTSEPLTPSAVVATTPNQRRTYSSGTSCPPSASVTVLRARCTSNTRTRSMSRVKAQRAAVRYQSMEMDHDGSGDTSNSSANRGNNNLRPPPIPAPPSAFLCTAPLRYLRRRPDWSLIFFDDLNDPSDSTIMHVNNTTTLLVSIQTLLTASMTTDPGSSSPLAYRLTLLAPPTTSILSANLVPPDTFIASHASGDAMLVESPSPHRRRRTGSDAGSPRSDQEYPLQAVEKDQQRSSFNYANKDDK
ncbi:hypothetical protein BDQ12DRAFT_728939 [Crucibulum laeve]|uniref:Uncharacterized protein n=1 Tax=Crucibulum laeve TaxID=68775 RepID=A0A5C3LH98_9AGAR|nr:hypothetical protein BDQ12DRAFT_728939 [Crucibulum laeve]